MLATQSFLKDNFIPAFNIEYLVIAGGAGVGSGYSGSGAGGYRTNFGTEMSGGGNSGGEADFEVTSGVALSIIVGAGSAGANGTKTDGSASTFSTISCVGGGASGYGYNSVNAQGNLGGSGGGTYGASTTTPSESGGLGTANQGFKGGWGVDGLIAFTGGGSGGGAGAIGNIPASSNPPNGGAGLNSSITGSSVGRGGGGCGFVNNNNTSGSGTHGAAAANGGNGAVNTGAGGGPKANESVYGNGGSGVVILRIPDARSATFTGGVTSSLNTSVSGFKIYSVTATSDTSQTVTFL